MGCSVELGCFWSLEMDCYLWRMTMRMEDHKAIIETEHAEDLLGLALRAQDRMLEDCMPCREQTCNDGHPPVDEVDSTRMVEPSAETEDDVAFRHEPTLPPDKAPCRCMRPKPHCICPKH